MRKLSIAAAAASMALLPLASVATAQTRNVVSQQGGLVNVSVGNVDLLKNFANNNEIEILNNANISVPVVVQAPINVAAQVCGVAVNVLARGGPANSTCTATQGSEALTDLAIRQMQAR